MRYKFKMEYLKKIYQRYHGANRKEKKQILDEFCKICGYNRKYAIWLLNNIHPEDRLAQKRKSNYRYKKSTISILEIIWEAAGYPWSERLKAMLPIWVPYLKKHYNISQETETELLSMSPSTIDRRLKNKKYSIKKRIYTTTRPGYLLKNQIPIKTDSWNIHKPGFLEIDLVAHCGSSLQDTYINSLNCVDIYTTWTETRAVMGRGQMATFEAIQDIRNSLPFPLLGIDPDNDAPFINYHLWTYCVKNNIYFTRSRPYKKDDNAHIEQKNWTHVRKIFGYVRYDTQEALQSMNDLYRNELRWFQNFFQPSVKLIKKIRIGSKLKRIYDKPRTPFQRLCESKYADPVKLAELKKLFLSLDPFELSKTIDIKLNRIYQMRARKNKSQRTFEKMSNTELLNDFSYSNLRLDFQTT